jgi:hypothetical protein
MAMAVVVLLRRARGVGKTGALPGERLKTSSEELIFGANGDGR